METSNSCSQKLHDGRVLRGSGIHGRLRGVSLRGIATRARCWLCRSLRALGSRRCRHLDLVVSLAVVDADGKASPQRPSAQCTPTLCEQKITPTKKGRPQTQWLKRNAMCDSRGSAVEVKGVVNGQSTSGTYQYKLRAHLWSGSRQFSLAATLIPAFWSLALALLSVTQTRIAGDCTASIALSSPAHARSHRLRASRR